MKLVKSVAAQVITNPSLSLGSFSAAISTMFWMGAAVEKSKRINNASGITLFKSMLRMNMVLMIKKTPKSKTAAQM